MATRILIPSGVLGLGFNKMALNKGVANRPEAICIDGGSTDSGPFYLGTGTGQYAESATRSEWKDLMIARHAAGVPLILGSCGTCGRSNGAGIFRVRSGNQTRNLAVSHDLFRQPDPGGEPFMKNAG